MNGIILGIGIILMGYFLSRLTLFIELTYCRMGKDDRLLVKLYLLRGLLCYQLKIPIMEFVYDIDKLRISNTMDAGGKVTTDTNLIRLFEIYIKHPQKLKKMIRLFQHLTEMYRAVMDRIVAQLQCEMFYLETHVGFQDAGLTGMLIGHIWIAITLYLQRLSHKFQFTQRPIIKVFPEFQQPLISINFHCIFSIRLGNVINASLHIFSQKEAVKSG